MSGRADLLPAKNCLELAKISRSGMVTPVTLVRQVLENEIEDGLEESFISFEDEPFESQLMFQSHYARLVDNSEVAVKLIHPEFEEQLSCDLDLLPLLREGFVGCGLSERAFKSALADFQHNLHERLHFDHEVRAFEALAHDVEDYDA